MKIYHIVRVCAPVSDFSCWIQTGWHLIQTNELLNFFFFNESFNPNFIKCPESPFFTKYWVFIKIRINFIKSKYKQATFEINFEFLQLPKLKFFQLNLLTHSSKSGILDLTFKNEFYIFCSSIAKGFKCAYFFMLAPIRAPLSLININQFYITYI